jgi:hypothetical protein
VDQRDLLRRDISGNLRISGDGMDFPYIEHWAVRKDLTEIWRAILMRNKG